MRQLVALPVVMPLLGAALTLVLAGRPRIQRMISVIVLAATLAVACVLLVATARHGALVIGIGAWPAPVGIVLVADRLSALLLVISAAVTLCVLLYSIGQGQADGEEETPVSVYHPTYLVLTAGVTNAFLAGDLFNLFVGFEVLLAASYVLITLGGTEVRIRVGTTYVVVSLLSSMIFLSAIGLVYAATGTLNLAQLAGRLDALPDNLRLTLQVMLLLAFSIKAAVFPLSAWLPDSYPSAPAPVTAVFAGLLTKVGIYAIIRTQTLLFPGGRATDVLLVLGLLTMLIGVLGAMVQSDIKRLLSFTLVSHIGYMLFGVALTSVAGLAGAIFYVVHHITVQTTLFLAAGLVERWAGSTDLDRLGGLARASPLLGVLFFLPAINLAGVPPFSGFLGKVGLLQAGVTQGGLLPWLLVAGASATSLLTLYAIVRVWGLAFWRPPRTEPDGVGPVTGAGGPAAGVGADGPASRTGEAGPPPRIELAERADPAAEAAGPPGAGLATGAGSATAVAGPPAGPGGGAGPDEEAGPDDADRGLPGLMVGATVALVALGVAFTLVAGPLYRVTGDAAEELRQRTPYVQAVFPGGAP